MDHKIMYTIENLEVYFPENKLFAVHGVDFNIKQHSIFALVGETGSGKTMISKSMTGLLPKNAVVTGKVKWHGEDILKKSKKELQKYRQNNVAMVFQSSASALNPLLTLRKQFELSVNYKLATEQMFDVLKKVGLEASMEFLKKYPFELSGGMKQRFLLAMAMLKKPELLILDEPTRGLDNKRRDEIIKEIEMFYQETETSILLITHDLYFARALSQEMAVLYEGKIVEMGVTESLFINPRHMYFKALMDALPENGFQVKDIDRSHLKQGALIQMEVGHYVRCSC